MTQREEFVEAVEEYAQALRVIGLDRKTHARQSAARSRLLQLWDAQQAEVERLREMALKPEDAQGNHIYFKGFLSERIIEKIKPLYVSGSPREERSDG